MGHDYAYGVRLDSEGSGTAFGSAVVNARIFPEQHPGLRTRPHVLPNRHGARVDSRGFFANYSFTLELLVNYGIPEDSDTLYANRDTVLERLLHHLEPVWLQRTAPDQGAVELPIRVLRSSRIGDPTAHNRLRIPCTTLDPFWRDQAVTHNAVNPASGVTVGGNAPIGDAILAVSGGTGVQRLTHTPTGDYIELDYATTPAVTIDIGKGTVKQSGGHVDDAVTDAPKPWMIELAPGANAFSVSGTGTWTLTARDKWL